VRQLGQRLVKRFAPGERGDVAPFIRLAAHHVHVDGAIHHLERLARALAFEDAFPADLKPRMCLIERDRREHVLEHLALFIGQDRSRNHRDGMDTIPTLHGHLSGDFRAGMIAEQVHGIELERIHQ